MKSDEKPKETFNSIAQQMTELLKTGKWKPLPLERELLGLGKPEQTPDGYNEKKYPPATKREVT